MAFSISLSSELKKGLVSGQLGKSAGKSSLCSLSVLSSAMSQSTRSALSISVLMVPSCVAIGNSACGIGY